MKHLVITLSLVISFHVSAEVYKWIDENGNTHYSQSPPVSGIDVKKMDITTKHDSADAQEQISKQTERADTLRDQRLKKEDEKANLAAEEKKRQENCEQAKKALESYTGNPRLLIETDDGGQRKLLEEERQEKIKQSQKAVKDFCS